MCCLSLYEYNLLDSTFPSLVPECQQSRQKGIKVNVCFSTLGKHLTEKTIYILIAFFHYINSSSAFHPGGGMNVCKLLASIRIKETLEAIIHSPISTGIASQFGLPSRLVVLNLSRT